MIMDTRTFGSNTFLESISNQHEIQKKRKKYDFVIESIKRIEKENFGSLGYQPKTYNHRAKKYSLKTNCRARSHQRAKRKGRPQFSANMKPTEHFGQARHQKQRKTAQLGIMCVNSFQRPKSVKPTQTPVSQNQPRPPNPTTKAKTDGLASRAAAGTRVDWERRRVLESIKDFACRLSKNPVISDAKKLEAYGLLRRWKNSPNGPSLAAEINSIVRVDQAASKTGKDLAAENKTRGGSSERDYQPLKTGTLMQVVEDSKQLSGEAPGRR